MITVIILCLHVRIVDNVGTIRSNVGAIRNNDRRQTLTEVLSTYVRLDD